MAGAEIRPIVNYFVNVYQNQNSNQIDQEKSRGFNARLINQFVWLSLVYRFIKTKK